jgi:hypothetical protein
MPLEALGPWVSEHSEPCMLVSDALVELRWGLSAQDVHRRGQLELIIHLWVLDEGGRSLGRLVGRIQRDAEVL